MAKLLFFSDVHLAERPPLARSESYKDDVFGKLEELREMAAGCDVSVFGGDLYHWSRPPETSHRLVRNVIELFRRWPIPLYVVVGNHDLPPEQMGGLYRTPLGVVLEALRGGQMRLLGHDEVCDIDGLRIQLSPLHWQHNIDERPELYGLNRLPDVDFAVKIAHGMVMPPGGGWPFPATPIDAIPTVGMDLFLWGHTHWRTPPVQLNGTWFASPGAISRTARSPDEMGRAVSALIITFDEKGQIALEEVPLKSMRPAEEVFVWHEKAESPTDGLFAGYVAALETGLDVQGLSIEDALAALEQQADPAVVKLAREYLERAGLG